MVTPVIWQDGAHFPNQMTVAIIGGGPAGLGVARVLRDLAIPDVWVLERGQVGQSFRDWPTGTQLLTPSFPGNVFGVTDLNAISFDSSPGWSLRSEHPSGEDYALYLEHAAAAFGINVQCGIDVDAIEPRDEGFAITTDRGIFTADFVIWACGHFNEPSDGGLPGAELARHYGTVPDWEDVPGDVVYVIGGYESGIDAAIGLARTGKDVIVLDRGAPWLDGDKDPSRSLSPYTQQRLDAVRKGLSITLLPDAEIIALDHESDGVHILSGDGRSWLSDGPPILATGFGSGTARVSDWFDYDSDGVPLLTPQDESTAMPGLFLVGPEVSHRGHLFCFIYKFRQRFAIVARTIAGRMGVDTSPLEVYYENNMLLDDLTCCDDDKCLC
ncbi:MAG: NAD(P)-binding domain-containing protein [Pseudomonadota bacterium]